jgi:hypothetical protein
VKRRLAIGVVGVISVLAAACSGGSGQEDIVLGTRPTEATSRGSGTDHTGGSTDPSSGDTPATEATTAPVEADVTVTVDVAATGPEISPAIRGATSDSLTTDEMHQAGFTVNSWGGNPITRYNYELGNAFNHGSDYQFRNTSYGNPPEPLAQNAVLGLLEAGIEARLAIPTLGWVAKNTDENTCSFPGGPEGCLGKAEVGDCSNQQEVADPERTSVRSTPEQVRAWLTEMAEAGARPQYVAMDNEPDLWGHTHYDVHPECPTYEEILEKYLDYATVVQEVMPDAALLGPVMCCWYDYWKIAPGPEGEGEDDFVAWFLDGVRAHDEQTGERTLDYLDVHFYPQSNVFNDEVDEETSARRLRSTQALWDPDYRDESWITEAIRFIPRMQETIEAHYPGTKLFISEWNFGAEETMNGALAIADTLGIYGREGVEAATYYRNPDAGSPGFYAFAMYGNYDGEGSSFEGTSVHATNSEDLGAARVTSYAAYDDAAGVLRVMLVNRDPAQDLTVALDLPGFEAAPEIARYSYGPADLSGIVADTVPVRSAVNVPASSITLLVVEPA